MACNIQLIRVNPIDPDAGSTGFLFHNGEMILDICSGEIVASIMSKEIDLDAAELGFESDEEWDWRTIRRVLKAEGLWNDKAGIVDPTQEKANGKRGRDR